MKTGHGLPKEMTSPLKQEKDAKTGHVFTERQNKLLNTDQISDKRVRQLAKSKFGEYDSNYKRLHKEQQAADSTFIMKNQTTITDPSGGKTGNDEVRSPSKFARGVKGNLVITNAYGYRDPSL